MQPKTELAMLEDVAKKIYSKCLMIPCTGCRYCMPCPFSVDIPANFAYYNKCVNDGTIPPTDTADPEIQADGTGLRRRFNKAVPEKQQALTARIASIVCPTVASASPTS